MENGYGIEYFKKDDENDSVILGAKLYDVYGEAEKSQSGRYVYDSREVNNKPYYINRDELIKLIKNNEAFYNLTKISDESYSCMPITLNINHKDYINGNDEQEKDFVQSIRIKDY